jgi:TM2 domain-containing membrane protein YozV
MTYARQMDPMAKSKVVAGILGILLGGFGIHRFYLGYVGLGIVQIIVTFLTCGFGAMWGIVEGILILVGSGITADSTGRPLRDN